MDPGDRNAHPSSPPLGFLFTDNSVSFVTETYTRYLLTSAIRDRWILNEVASHAPASTQSEGYTLGIHNDEKEILQLSS
ncbi:hypothetical protein Tco_1066920 [Tanacetum coccineum]|uniref:Uncharacterized protein n=1 Tax=Tanacetum coccineum TaxID=301880 RepID=A0ABQ5HBD8_9ASTR